MSRTRLAALLVKSGCLFEQLGIVIFEDAPESRHDRRCAARGGIPVGVGYSTRDEQRVAEPARYLLVMTPRIHSLIEAGADLALGLSDPKAEPVSEDDPGFVV